MESRDIIILGAAAAIGGYLVYKYVESKKTDDIEPTTCQEQCENKVFFGCDGNTQLPGAYQTGKCGYLLGENPYDPPIIIIPDVPETTDVKVVSIYERVSDGIGFGRQDFEMANMIRDTHTDMVLRGFFRWQPVPESPGMTLPGYSSSYVNDKASLGYTYSQLGSAIAQLKSTNPNTLFIGAIAAQRLNQIEFNEKTRQQYTQPQTWAMALDPTVYGVPVTKEHFQCKMTDLLGFQSSQNSCNLFNPASTSVTAYYPDITNVDYQTLLLSYAEKQIDLGADGIWIDMFFGQASMIYKYTNNANHPGIKSAFAACSKIVDSIHSYGLSTHGSDVLVGTWWNFMDLPYSPPVQPDLDFVTAVIPAEDITGEFNTTEWTRVKNVIRGKMGNIPVYTYIDWSPSPTAPMSIFSQKPSIQIPFLQRVDVFFTSMGMNFVYPLHGGTFPLTSSIKSFGKYAVYDSKAPEFNTFETIKTLANAKAVR